jgi:ubiquinone/menaquinone biosynthesis C-methylase UbiE
MSSDVIRANVEVHSRLVEVYKNEPHFRPENQAKVRDMLVGLRQRAPGGKLLDIGCGTGFIINLARDVFDDIHGVDVTPAMLAKIDTSRGNITLHNTSAERLPFGHAEFDVVTGYSFLHHLEDFRPVLGEVFRVLKPGGTFQYGDILLAADLNETDRRNIDLWTG